MRVSILTVSDRASRREYADKTGPAIAKLIEQFLKHAEVKIDVLADERSLIEKALLAYGEESIDLVLTNGGTGLGPRDVTPEATQAIATRVIPGVGEAMRAAGRAHTPLADLSRGIAAQLNNTLIINLPGSPKGATESLRAIIELIPHALSTIRQQS